MKTITVVTPHNVEIEYRLAGAGSRTAAFVIDLLVQVALMVLSAWLIVFGLFGFRFATLYRLGGTALGLVLVTTFALYFGYFIACEMLMNGQSVGKRVFRLRVIRDNGLPVAFPQSLTRNLFRAVLDVMYVGLFCILFSAKHKRLGDIVAGTLVVAEASAALITLERNEFHGNR